MRCPTCRRTMISTSSREIEDEQGAMTITRWRCRPCHETAEEIRLSTGYRGSDLTTIRYAVTPLRQRQTAASVRMTVTRGTHAYAGTL